MENMEGIRNIRDYAALSRGGEDWTGAFRAAVDAAEADGGGILFVPAGKYPTYSIVLKSDMTLYLSAGAEIVFRDDPEGYDFVSDVTGEPGDAGPSGATGRSTAAAGPGGPPSGKTGGSKAAAPTSSAFRSASMCVWRA